MTLLLLIIKAALVLVNSLLSSQLSEHTMTYAKDDDVLENKTQSFT